MLLSYRGRFVEDKDAVLTVVEGVPQVGIISSETVIESSSLGVRAIYDGSSSTYDAVLRLHVILPSSSLEMGMVVTLNGTEGPVRFSRGADSASSIGWLTVGVGSGRLNGTALGGDVNLERNFLAGGSGGGTWNLLESCSASCSMLFIAARSKPACIGR